MVKKTIEKKKKQTVLKEDSTTVGVLKRFHAPEIQEKRDKCKVTLTFDDNQQIRFEFATEKEAVRFQDYVFLWNKRASIAGVEFLYKPKERPGEYIVSVLVASLRIERIFGTKEDALSFVKEVEFMMDKSCYRETVFELTGYGRMYCLATDNSFSFSCYKSNTKVFF
jgi:hypothetical protein